MYIYLTLSYKLDIIYLQTIKGHNMKNTIKAKYEEAVSKLIDSMEENGQQWVKSWSGSSAGMPYNESTNKGYRGINILLLWMQSVERGYKTNRYMTFKQALSIGGKVKKGERGTSVFFYTMAESKKLNEKGEKTKYPMIKYYTVFNIEQIEGIEFDIKEPKTYQNETIGHVEDYISSLPITIKYEGFQPCYSPAMDEVRTPPLERFVSTEDFYSTLFHELGHSTGHKNRLNRKMGETMASKAYGFEELVAELTSVFMCGEFNINIQNCQHVEYLEGWVKAIRENKNILWKAASEAQKATDYLLECSKKISKVA